MKRIEILDQAMNEQVRDLNELGINPSLMKAYRTSLKVDNDHINFEEVIWDREIEPITTFLYHDKRFCGIQKCNLKWSSSRQEWQQDV